MTIYELRDLANVFVAKDNEDMEVKLVLCQTHNNLEYEVGEVGLDENGNLRLETGDQIGYAGADIVEPW